MAIREREAELQQLLARLHGTDETPLFVSESGELSTDPRHQDGLGREMSVEETAVDIWEFAMLNGGALSWDRYLSLKSYGGDDEPYPAHPVYVPRAMYRLVRQGHATPFYDEKRRIDGVFVGEGHAERAAKHAWRAKHGDMHPGEDDA